MSIRLTLSKKCASAVHGAASMLTMQFEAQYRSNMGNFLKMEFSKLRTTLGHLVRDLDYCLNSGLRIIREPQFDRMAVLYSRVMSLKDELLDFVLLARTHYCACQDMLEKFRLDSFSKNRKVIVEYLEQHEPTFTPIFTKTPQIPFQCPHISELRDTFITVSSLDVYEHMKRLFESLKSQRAETQRDLPRCFPVVVPNLCTHNGEPSIVLSSSVGFIHVMSAYHSFLHQVRQLPVRSQRLK